MFLIDRIADNICSDKGEKTFYRLVVSIIIIICLILQFYGREIKEYFILALGKEISY